MNQAEAGPQNGPALVCSMPFFLWFWMVPSFSPLHIFSKPREHFLSNSSNVSLLVLNYLSFCLHRKSRPDLHYASVSEATVSKCIILDWQAFVPLAHSKDVVMLSSGLPPWEINLNSHPSPAFRASFCLSWDSRFHLYLTGSSAWILWMWVWLLCIFTELLKSVG